MRISNSATVATIGIVVTATTLFAVVSMYNIPPSVYGYCRPSSPTMLNDTDYRTCEITPDWSRGGPSGFTPTEIAKTTFSGVFFDLYAYNTMNSPVVNVTGIELSGVTEFFLIAPCPEVCNQTNFTVISQDSDFGATWDINGATISLLVRTG